MLLKIIMAFVVCVMAGLVLEFVYRSITNKRVLRPKLVNAKMYGFTGAFFYFIYFLNLALIWELILIFIIPTIIEFITGHLYLKSKGLYLWDYSKESFNFKKLICLRFSFYWFIIGLVYYYLVLPFIDSLL